MRGYEARILDADDAFLRNLVRLVVRDGDTNSYLLRDGTWRTVEEGTVIEGIGIELPGAAIEAIAVAIQEWQGHASHADTEARVLREWLALERERVDKALAR